MCRTRTTRALATLLLGLAAAPASAAAQDGNITFPVDELEQRLRDDTLIITDWRGSRMEKDRTQRVLLEYPDGTVLLTKWAKAPYGGGEFNNEPRYELAAYTLQKLFLEPQDYVVPPTVLRAVPTAWLREHDPTAGPTFDHTSATLVLLQYWLMNVTNVDFWQEDRFERDSVYARHLADMNVLTYLIRHADENVGNFLVSQDTLRPRVFSVDNGVSFRSEPSNRGYAWRDLRIDRLPHGTVERLRAITREDLDRTLAILATFEIRGDMLYPVDHPENLRDGRGVRRTDSHVQLGLTKAELNDVHNRLRRLVERIDQGRIKTF